MKKCNEMKTFNYTTVYLELDTVVPWVQFITLILQADIGRGSGGPIDGNDIAVYHVDHHGFLLGENVYVRDTPNPADQPELKSSESYIWPACLPKDDTDERFDPDTDLDPSNPYYIHPNRKKDTVNAMLAGWLDAPPISQAFSNLLGSSLSEADVLK